MTYSYDPSGNRLTKVSSGAVTTLSYDQADRLLTTDDGTTVTTYSWDANGNNTLVQAGASVTTYTWDGENRLTKLALPGGSVVTNTYGSDGLRRKREDGVATVKYLWDGSRLLLESDGSDVTQAVYTSSVGAYGDTVSQRRSSATHYHHPDHLGTIWNLSDSSQATSDSYVFDAWGNQLASSGTTVNPFRYVGSLGYYAEPTAALTYVRARWLRPATGSWVSVDPVTGSPRAGYTCRPTLHIDESGLHAVVFPADYPEFEILTGAGAVDDIYQSHSGPGETSFRVYALTGFIQTTEKSWLPGGDVLNFVFPNALQRPRTWYSDSFLKLTKCARGPIEDHERAHQDEFLLERSIAEAVIKEVNGTVPREKAVVRIVHAYLQMPPSATLGRDALRALYRNTVGRAMPLWGDLEKESRSFHVASECWAAHVMKSSIRTHWTQHRESLVAAPPLAHECLCEVPCKELVWINKRNNANGRKFCGKWSTRWSNWLKVHGFESWEPWAGWHDYTDPDARDCT